MNKKWVNKITATYFYYNTFSTFVRCSSKYYKTVPIVSSVISLLLIFFLLREKMSYYLHVGFWNIFKFGTTGSRCFWNFWISLLGFFEIRQKQHIDFFVGRKHYLDASQGNILLPIGNFIIVQFFSKIAWIIRRNCKYLMKFVPS